MMNQSHESGDSRRKPTGMRDRSNPYFNYRNKPGNQTYILNRSLFSNNKNESGERNIVQDPGKLVDRIMSGSTGNLSLNIPPQSASNSIKPITFDANKKETFSKSSANLKNSKKSSGSHSTYNNNFYPFKKELILKNQSDKNENSDIRSDDLLNKESRQKYDGTKNNGDLNSTKQSIEKKRKSFWDDTNPQKKMDKTSLKVNENNSNKASGDAPKNLEPVADKALETTIAGISGSVKDCLSSYLTKDNSMDINNENNISESPKLKKKLTSNKANSDDSTSPDILFDSREKSTKNTNSLKKNKRRDSVGNNIDNKSKMPSSSLNLSKTLEKGDDSYPKKKLKQPTDGRSGKNDSSQNMSSIEISKDRTSLNVKETSSISKKSGNSKSKRSVSSSSKKTNKDLTKNDTESFVVSGSKTASGVNPQVDNLHDESLKLLKKSGRVRRESIKGTPNETTAPKSALSSDSDTHPKKNNDNSNCIETIDKNTAVDLEADLKRRKRKSEYLESENESLNNEDKEPKNVSEKNSHNINQVAANNDKQFKFKCSYKSTNENNDCKVYSDSIFCPEHRKKLNFLDNLVDYIAWNDFDEKNCENIMKSPSFKKNITELMRYIKFVSKCDEDEADLDKKISRIDAKIGMLCNLRATTIQHKKNIAYLRETEKLSLKSTFECILKTICDSNADTPAELRLEKRSDKYDQSKSSDLDNSIIDDIDIESIVEKKKQKKK